MVDRGNVAWIIYTCRLHFTSGKQNVSEPIRHADTDCCAVLLGKATAIAPICSGQIDADALRGGTRGRFNLQREADGGRIECTSKKRAGDDAACEGRAILLSQRQGARV